MKKRCSVEQIIRTLGEIECGGPKISSACRPHGISEQAYDRWRNKYGGMETSEARRLQELEGENGRLKKLVVDQALDIQKVKEKNGKPRRQGPNPDRKGGACHTASAHRPTRPKLLHVHQVRKIQAAPSPAPETKEATTFLKPL